MTVTNRIQLGRDAKVFVVQETTAGTQAYPTDTDKVIPSGSVEFNQQPSYTPTTEVRGSRSMRTRFLDQNPAGTWSIPMYCRPSGTAGSIPDGHILLYGAFGSTTTYAGSSVTYTLSNDDHVTLTIYVGMKDMVFALIGCTVNEFKAAVNNKGGINYNFSGGFMTMRWAGKAVVTGYTTKVFTMAADDASMFVAGMKIRVWDDSASAYYDSGAIYTITAVVINGASSTVTISETCAITYASGDWIEGYLPTGTEIGTAIEARASNFYLDGGTTAIPIITADITLTNNIKYLEDEISTAVYPTGFSADTRNALAALQLYLRTDDLNYFKQSGLLASGDKVQGNLVLRGGDTAGSKMQIAMPVVDGSVPNLSGDLEKMIAIDFQGLASASYNDEIKLTMY